jgi:hypothetical protein
MLSTHRNVLALLERLAFVSCVISAGQRWMGPESWVDSNLPLIEPFLPWAETHLFVSKPQKQLSDEPASSILRLSTSVSIVKEPVILCT